MKYTYATVILQLFQAGKEKNSMKVHDALKMHNGFESRDLLHSVFTVVKVSFKFTVLLGCKNMFLDHT